MTFAILGGILIGISASLMLMITGRITGISGILGSIIRPDENDKIWRFLFIAGLLAGGVIMSIWKTLATYQTIATMTDFILAGLFVGIGTSLGSGCTSGHGVCGISRLSIRSIIATICFMIFGIMSVLLFKYIRGQL